MYFILEEFKYSSKMAVTDLIPFTGTRNTKKRHETSSSPYRFPSLTLSRLQKESPRSSRIVSATPAPVSRGCDHSPANDPPRPDGTNHALGLFQEQDLVRPELPSFCSLVTSRTSTFVAPQALFGGCYESPLAVSKIAVIYDWDSLAGCLDEHLSPVLRQLDIHVVSDGGRVTRSHSILPGLGHDLDVAARSPPAFPFQCNYCPIGFANENDLERHMRKHTADRPFRCGYCTMCFLRKDHLSKHLQSHTGERPHACVHCPKSFTRKDNLRRHVLLHHQ
ncbi:uncharacterized protein LOC144158109 [Haemaphysalis longicornis]